MKYNHPLPDTWADPSFEDFLREQIRFLDSKKKSVISLFTSETNPIILSDLSEVTLTEGMSIDLSRIAQKPEILDVAATLQAFQTYRLSLYDILDDKHLTKLCKPTVLAIYGEDAVKAVAKIYNSSVLQLAEELEEKGVSEASKLAQQQYDDTIKTDKIRGEFVSKMPSPEEAIRLQRNIAGGPAKGIVKLAGGDHSLEEGIATLVDALTTLEDLIGFIDMEDFTRVKATIPLAFLYEECLHIEKPRDIREIIRETKVIVKTREYVRNMIHIAKKEFSPYRQISPILSI